MTDSGPPALCRSPSVYLGRPDDASRLSKLPAPEWGSYSAAQKHLASRAWILRGEEEFRSAAMFTELLSLLTHLPAPLDVLHAVAGIVGDELHHAELCSLLAARSGADRPRVRLAPVRERLGSLPSDPRRRALALLLVEGALGETLSSALFSGGRHGTREPCSRAALGLILRDEVRHARVCWEVLRVLQPESENGELDFLQAEVGRALGYLEQTQALPALRHLEAGETFDPALAELGVLPPQRRVEIFYRTLKSLRKGRLGQLGLDGQLAWDRRYRER